MESTIIQLKYEDLLHFIITDLNKCIFFQNSNLSYLKDKYKKVKLKNFLIKNIECEYKHENEKKE